MEQLADDLLTPEEVAAELRCCIVTVARYRLKGRLGYKKLNSRRFLYPRSAVEALKSQQ